MSENTCNTYTVLQLRFKLRVRPRILLAQAREAATTIASVEGLLWKIWLSQEEESEIGGVYLFASRETAEAYLSHPAITAVSSNPAVVSTQFHLSDVVDSLSALTRAPLPHIRAQYSGQGALVGGGR